MKINVLKAFCVFAVVGLSVLSANCPAKEQGAPTASAHGKYADLLQELTCPADAEKYGKFKDYGYWEGGQWCGQMGKAGYWVWLKPTWYVWRTKNAPHH